MTYKALRRKSDKQWMMRLGIGVMKCDYPIPQSLTLEQLKAKCIKADWSLYELVTVYVIAEDEFLSDEFVQKHIESVRHESGQPMMDEQTFYEGAKWFKSQILKP